ncbi:Pimeloyl-ACP methyl ester carboxylesterase [Micromonospora pattaloongensis]|uniref:Pimeloyl-ACP methyl ester carboxylesterase n=1 Tax=Micromonospora pattaloongensis TaxID=405436 RepID=A0A1H3PBL9_9ACTN|nr:alpha/beta hydrolase [Micromonospora pattaloongensis]SDY98205.1 Pimeloyl-ACP methyl ester carboxylesterase [Micromonospora pattaloongensis]
MSSLVTAISTGLNTTSLASARLAGGLAFWLFRHPLRRAAVSAREQEVHARAERGTLVVDGRPVVTYRWGDGERPVLLLHGWESRASHFAALAAGLVERGCSPVSFDASGHGDSAGRRGSTILEYRAIIERLSAEHGPFVAIVAHSFGVPCAFYAVRTGAARTERIVSLAGISEFAHLTDAFCAQLRLRPAIRDDLRRRTERYFAAEEHIWQRFSACHEPAQVGVPVLVVHDPADPEVPIAQAHRMRDAYGATFVNADGAGHRRILKDPAVVAAVLDFVAPAPARS